MVNVYRSLVLLVAMSLPALSGDYRVQNPDGRALESFVAEGPAGMVASASAEASRIGAEVLRRGGNAVDAAVAVSFAVSVIRPQSTGIGGGGFLLSFDNNTDRTEVYDFRETAPAAATRDMYLDEDGDVIEGRSLVGHLAVGVPGVVAGLARVHAREGSLRWEDLIAPAIALARDGFEVYPELARRLERRAEFVGANPAARKIFFRKERPLREGERLWQKDLATTLERIASEGADGFYLGPVAEAIATDMERHHGLISLHDLSSYRVKMREPVAGSYRGLDILSMPPPSSGGTDLIQMLNVLEGYDLGTLGREAPETIHVMAEAMRQAYADRAEFMGDPDFVDVPVERLISREYAEQIRSTIRMGRAGDSSRTKPGLAAPRESESTTHLSVVDANGNAVSSTQTINYSFGACVVAEGTGVLLNDEMDDFAIAPGVPNVYGLVGGAANAVAPGKRPLSSMSPTLVLRDGKPVLVVGSPGGSRIITSVLQTVVNVADHDLDLPDAVATGRIHHQWLPDRLEVEAGALPEPTIRTLREWGHEVFLQESPIGEVQAVLVTPDGTRIGMSDPRRSGGPAAQ